MMAVIIFECIMRINGARTRSDCNVCFLLISLILPLGTIFYCVLLRLKNNLHYPKWNCLVFSNSVSFSFRACENSKRWFSQQMEVCERKQDLRVRSSLVVHWLRLGAFTAMARVQSQARAQPKIKI